MSKMSKTEPDGPYDYLLRDFPQLKNATSVGINNDWRSDDDFDDCRSS
jgi:hypothetical protein